MKGILSWLRGPSRACHRMASNTGVLSSLAETTKGSSQSRLWWVLSVFPTPSSSLSPIRNCLLNWPWGLDWTWALVLIGGNCQGIQSELVLIGLRSRLFSLLLPHCSPPHNELPFELTQGVIHLTRASRVRHLGLIDRLVQSLKRMCCTNLSTFLIHFKSNNFFLL